ncbi:ATP-binding protein [Methanosarcina sp.]|uniref:ATP-binding protein n=1 Tax=Methanosarcina sp. TaxID=2213 RepID=UPI002BF891F7|nr:ATP-binding protein [Methanosarcina sp.]HOW14044.1 ATP-binding protein [Methanosarcina sp.]
MSENESSVKLFEDNRIGRLMKLEESEQTRYQFEVWFEYTRQCMINLKEGTFLAAKNFSSSDFATHYSILELTSIKPIHYALGTNVDGYPGFVMEAAKNISSDWTSQEMDSFEDTTIIKCIATPTGLEIIEDDEGRVLGNDSSIPMIGTEVKVLTGPATKWTANKGMSTDDFTFEVGKWLVDRSTPIYIDIEELLRVHFGVFGFTKSGKSNFLSMIISNILDISKNKGRPVKIVIFDLMSEYNILLIDQLSSMSYSRLIALGEATFPGAVIEHLLAENASIDKTKQKAINSLIETSLYPKDLERIKTNFNLFLSTLFDERKIRLFNDPEKTLRSFILANEGVLTAGNTGTSKTIISQFISNIQLEGNQVLDSTILGIVNSSIEEIFKRCPLGSGKKTNSSVNLNFFEKDEENKRSQKTKNTINLLKDIDFSVSLTSTATTNLKEFQKLIQLELQNASNRKSYPPESLETMEDLLLELNNKDHSSLIVIQSHDADRIRDFAYDLGNSLYENRRKYGKTFPLVSFIFDEADEFIPQNFDKNSSFGRSNHIAHMLARRGRKYGIGIGIATQRATYLNTSIMSQPHTYFVSKLPRLTDRSRVQEAFGLSDEMLRQTLKFSTGDWVVVSHDATGMTGVPIPVHTKDANERIKLALMEVKNG